MHLYFLKIVPTLGEHALRPGNENKSGTVGVCSLKYIFFLLTMQIFRFQKTVLDVIAENLLFRIENINLDEKQDEVKLDFLGKANIR